MQRFACRVLAPARLVGPAAGRSTVLAGLLTAVLAFGVHAAPLADRQGAPSGIDAPPSSSAGSTLDRTLQVDTDAVQRDVELLLETRGSADGDPPPAAGRPARSAAAGSASAARATGPRTADTPTPGGTAADRDAVPEPVRDAVRFLRAHRFWLLGAVGLCAVGVVGAQLWRRQRAGASERRQRELAGQQRSSRGRRRSSRH